MRRRSASTLLAFLVLPFAAGGCETGPAPAVVGGSLDQEQAALKERMRARWPAAGDEEKQRWIDLLDLVEAIGRDVKDPTRSVDPDVWPDLATELVALQKRIADGDPPNRIRDGRARVEALWDEMVD